MNNQEPLIFIVDDDEDDRETLLTAFAENGSLDNVRMFASSNELMAVLNSVTENNLPKLFILDHQTPGHTGSDTLTLLKASERFKDIPVIVYSSSISSHLMGELKRKGAYACMEKADSLDKLQKQVQLFKQIAR